MEVVTTTATAFTFVVIYVIGYCAVLLLGSWVKRSPPYRGSELFSAYSLHDAELIETLPDNSVLHLFCRVAQIE